MIGGIGRYLYAAAFGLGLIAYGFAIYRAGFHFGVEQLWWDGWNECGGSSDSLNAMDLLAKPFKDCAVPTYIIPGVSMALGHLIAVLGTLLVSIGLWTKIRG